MDDSDVNSTQGFLSRQMSQIQISKLDLIKKCVIENKTKIIVFFTVLNFLMNIILIAKINNVSVPTKSADLEDLQAKINDLQAKINSTIEENKENKSLDAKIINLQNEIKPILEENQKDKNADPKIIDLEDKIKSMMEANQVNYDLDILMAKKMNNLTQFQYSYTSSQSNLNRDVKDLGKSLLSYYFQKVMNQIDGHYFYRYHNKMDYGSAITTCSKINAHLMDFGDDFKANLKKMKAVKTFYHLEDVSNIWIGLDDKTKENHWVWKHSGKTLPSNSSLWAPGEPDSLHESHDCVEVDIKEDTIQLYDVSCNRNLIVICEKCLDTDFNC